FAKDETLIALMGADAQFFDPSEDFTYVPVSSNIETEHTKAKKLQIIDNFIGRVGSIPNPNTPKLLNYLLGQAFKLFGKEFPEYEKYLLDESPASQQLAAQQGGGQAQPATMGAEATSNQSGVPQSAPEQDARLMGNSDNPMGV
ncbi:MAG: hypothetical protein AAB649_01065, partial [Patescibacteria group bacterium]